MGCAFFCRCDELYYFFFFMNFKDRIWDENTLMARAAEECTLFCRQDVEYYEFFKGAMQDENNMLDYAGLHPFVNRMLGSVKVQCCSDHSVIHRTSNISSSVV